MRILFFLFIAFSAYSQESQLDEIQVVKKQIGPDIHLVAINHTSDSYVIKVDVQSFGMDLSRKVPFETTIQPRAEETVLTLTPIPGKRWSYRQSYTYELAPIHENEVMEEDLVEDDPEEMVRTQNPPVNTSPERSENPGRTPSEKSHDQANDMESVHYKPKEYRTSEQEIPGEIAEQPRSSSPAKPQTPPPASTPRETRNSSSSGNASGVVARSEYIPSEVSDEHGHQSPVVKKPFGGKRKVPEALAFRSNQYIPGAVKTEMLENNNYPTSTRNVKSAVKERPVTPASEEVATPSDSRPSSTILGLRTVAYQVTDLEAAKSWYTEAFGTRPYFDEPYYVGFNIGGYELALQPSDARTPAHPTQTLTYWGVEDIASSWKHFLALGATEHEAPNSVGGGILVASLKDPWGNLIGLIYNPHFKAE